MAVLAIVMILLMMSEYGSSQLNNSSSSSSRDVNTLLTYVCGRNPVMSSASFLRNLNSTLAEMRSQLSTTGVYFAKAQSVQSSDAVFGLAQCRRYLSTDQCVACFDAAVSAVRTCSSVSNAYAVLDNCFLRYENYGQYYNNPQTMQDVGVPSSESCNNLTSSDPTTFIQTVGAVLSNIQVATSRSPNFYVATTGLISSMNKTIYAIGQCVANTTQAICQTCINGAYDNLYSCLTAIEGRAIDLGCYMRYSETPFFELSQATDITQLLTQASSSKLGMIAGVCVGVGIFLLIFALSLWYKLRKKTNNEAFDPLDESKLQAFKTYKFKDLQLATNDFGAEYRVGKGGYGEVFKAIMEDANTVAVKKLHVPYDKAKLEFTKEIVLISSVRHRNLMRLLGWSTDGPELLLVLEYVSQGSLDKFLWGSKHGSLSWRQRSDIVFGIARGIAHLHEESHIKIIHRDIKSNNILLDDDFQPKIADFGLARFQSEDETHVITRFAGTLGYTAPEYATHGRLSDKVDTYSFGIVTLEIISGRRCTEDVSFDGNDGVYLLQHAWQLYEKGIHIQLTDKALDPNEYEEEHVMKIIEIALKCTQSPPTSRPTMSEVVLMLTSWRSITPTQITRPTYVDPKRRILVNQQ